MPKAVITDHGFPHAEIEREVIESAGFEFADIKPNCKTEDDIIKRCAGVDALIVQWAPVTRRVLEALPQVKCIVRYGVGVNNFDLEAARDLGVVAVNVPDYCVEEVSNHAVAMMLSLARRIPQDHAKIVRGDWGINEFRPLPALSDMVLGLVSFGKIARRAAEKAQAFGLKVIAYDPFMDASVFSKAGVEGVDLETLFTTADVISLHCPLVAETQHLINRETLSKMKKGTILINTSRGPVVDEAALVAALQDGTLSGAGMDVFEEEPLPAGSPLRGLNNVILTSHSASLSEKALVMLQTKAAEAVRDFFQGKRPASQLVP